MKYCVRISGAVVSAMLMVLAPLSLAGAVGQSAGSVGNDALNPRSQASQVRAELPEFAPFDFMSGGSDVSTAAHWPSCDAITWTVDSMNIAASGVSPRREIARWQLAIDVMAMASGYRFDYVPVAAGAAAHSRDMGTPMVTGVDLVISYESATDENGYQRSSLKNPRTIAETSLAWFDSGTGLKISSLAAISMDYEGLVTSKKLGKSRAADRTSLMLHELGHVMGLGHSTDQKSIMFPTWMDGGLQLSPPDIAQLLSLAQLPCSN